MFQCIWESLGYRPVCRGVCKCTLHLTECELLRVWRSGHRTSDHFRIIQPLSRTRWCKCRKYGELECKERGKTWSKQERTCHEPHAALKKIKNRKVFTVQSFRYRHESEEELYSIFYYLFHPWHSSSSKFSFRALYWGLRRVPWNPSLLGKQTMSELWNNELHHLT